MEPILFLYGRDSWRELARREESDVVSAYPSIVTGNQGVRGLRENFGEDFVQKVFDLSYLYVDTLGASYYVGADKTPPAYFPGPGDWNNPLVRTRRGVYVYKLDKFYMTRFYRALWALANAKSFDVRGFFVDDFYSRYAPRHWEFDDGDKELVWGRLNSVEWIQLFNEFESALRAFMALRGRELIFNGPTDRAPRLFESVGDYITPDELASECRPGDAVLIKALKADGKTFGEVYWPEETSGYEPGTSFKNVIRDVLSIARDKKLRVGICYREKPDYGGSKCGVHEFLDPAKWAKI